MDSNALTPRHVQAATSQHEYDLTVILPRYSEGYGTICATLHRLSTLREQLAVQTIIVNDGGPSEALDLIEEEWRPDILLIHNDANRGKGYSVSRGVEAASGSIICYSDIDLPVSTATILEAFALIRSGEIDYIIGNRFGDRSVTIGASNTYRRFTSRWFLTLYNLLLEPDVWDSQCPFKLIPSKLAKQLFSVITIERYAFDAELIHIARLIDKVPHQLQVEWTDTRAPWTASKTAFVFVQMVKDLLTIKLYWIIRRRRLRALIVRKPPVAEPTS